MRFFRYALVSLSLIVLPNSTIAQDQARCEPIQFSDKSSEDIIAPLRDLASGELFYQEGDTSTQQCSMRKISRECAVERICLVSDWLEDQHNQGYVIAFEPLGETYMWSTFPDMMPAMTPRDLENGCHFETWHLCKVLSGEAIGSPSEVVTRFSQCLG